MADRYDRETRHRMMAAVKSKGTALERRIFPVIVTALGRSRLRVQPVTFGRPDFVKETRGKPLAIFVDSCFWHGCPKHARIPRSRVSYWRSKIEGNRDRDCSVSRRLRRDGYSVLRVWEHELARPISLSLRLRAALVRAVS